MKKSQLVMVGTGMAGSSNGPWRADDENRDWAGYFVSLNRSKKSIVLDLKTDEAKVAVRALVRSSHVLVENFRPGVMERLGLGYEELAKENPGLVYAAITGFESVRNYADERLRNPDKMSAEIKDGPMKRGLEVGFGPADHTGLDFVDLSIIDSGGKFRR